MTAENAEVSNYNNGTYVLIFRKKSDSLNSEVKQRMIDTFFTVYPQLVSRFNSDAPRTVKFVVDPNFNENPAATLENEVIFSAKWLYDHPADTDTVTHELMHVVQAYPSDNPGWLVEGIADYVRAKYGTNNGPADWSMPNYTSSQTYTDSYRVTARFLTWLEHWIKPSVVDELDSCMRQRIYNEQTWQHLVGKTINELWDQYSKNPHLSNTGPSTNILSGDTYKIININSDKTLDVAHSSIANGSNVQIYTDNGRTAQQWRVHDAGDDSYKLVNVNCDKVLDVDQSGTLNGTNVQVWEDNGSSAQRWRLQATGEKHVYKLVNVISNKVLDVDHSGTDNCTNVQIWADNDTAAQKWRLIKFS